MGVSFNADLIFKLLTINDIKMVHFTKLKMLQKVQFCKLFQLGIHFCVASKI